MRDDYRVLSKICACLNLLVSGSGMMACVTLIALYSKFAGGSFDGEVLMPLVFGAACLFAFLAGCLIFAGARSAWNFALAFQSIAVLLSAIYTGIHFALLGPAMLLFGGDVEEFVLFKLPIYAVLYMLVALAIFVWQRPPLESSQNISIQTLTPNTNGA